MIPLTNHEGRSEVVITYPDRCIYIIILYIYILKDIIKVSTGKWCHLAIQKLQKSMLPHGYVAWNPGIVS